MKDILAVQTHLEEEKEGSRLASSSSPISLEDLKRAEAVTQDTVSDLAAVQIPKRKAGGLPSLQSFGFNAAAMMGSQSAQFQKMEKLSQIDPADRTPEDLEELRKEVSRFSMIEKLRIAPEAVRSFIHCLRFKSYNFPGMNVVKEVGFFFCEKICPTQKRFEGRCGRDCADSYLGEYSSCSQEGKQWVRGK